jgi:hypothetical protein
MNHLTVALFATSDANHATVLNDYVAGANTMLSKYRMALEIYPTNPSGGPRILPYTGAVFDSPGDPEQSGRSAMPRFPTAGAFR